MPIYERYADYDVLASYSYNALKGYGPGWCYPVLINQTPLIYDLYTGRNEKNPQRDPGRLFGRFELHRKSNDVCEIWFIDKASSFDLERELTDEEKGLVGDFPLKGEKLDLYDEVKSRIRAEAEAEEELSEEHLSKVVDVYFRRLAEWGINLEKQFDAVHYGKVDIQTVQVNAGKPEKPKQMGRYRLTKDEIKRRKKIVKDAERIFKESNPKKTWKQIAYELGIPERTLRDWRHNPQY